MHIQKAEADFRSRRRCSLQSHHTLNNGDADPHSVSVLVLFCNPLDRKTLVLFGPIIVFVNEFEEVNSLSSVRQLRWAQTVRKVSLHGHILLRVTYAS